MESVMETISISTAASETSVPATTWKLDSSHSTVQFSVRHMMITNVRGEFGQVAGVVVYDPNRPEQAKVDVTIAVDSINTREPKRDAHLKSADFFDVERHPDLTFRSESVRRVGAQKLTIEGQLTIRGVTRPVTLEVEGPTSEHKDPWGNTRVGASATAKIRRSDFQMTWNAALEAGGVLVGDEVTLSIDVSLVRG
jgi:polyisoprenoid-binding protein YceI